MSKVQMSWKDELSIKLHGAKEHARREVRNATRRCGRIMAREIKAAVSGKTGLLKKSIGDKTKESRGDKITALAGPRRGFRVTIGKKEGKRLVGVREAKKGNRKIVLKSARGVKEGEVISATRYAHLADKGHKKGKGKGAARGQNFMATAKARSAPKVQGELREAFKAVKAARSV